VSVKTTVLETGRVPGNRREVKAEITLDSSYAEKGEPIAASEFSLARIIDAIVTVKNGTEAEATPVMGPWYDSENGTIRINNAKTQKEMEKEKDLSKVVLLAWVKGV